MSNELSPELRKLVRESVAELGDLIRREVGTARYRRIERIRTQMATLRDVTHTHQTRVLRKLLCELEKLNTTELKILTRAYTLMLELMNACENSYRTHRLMQRNSTVARDSQGLIAYVITAHPTESRAPANIEAFRKLQSALTRAWTEGWESVREDFRFWLQIAWQTPIARSRRPTVADEADYLFSILLAPGSLDALVEANRRFGGTYVRTWVGGDKDGHPGVNEKTFVQSLQRSRTILHHRLRDELKTARAEILARSKKPAFLSHLKSIQQELRGLVHVRPGDGARVKRLTLHLNRLILRAKAEFTDLPPALSRIALFQEIFPALVLPLEIREDASLVHEAASVPRSRATIARMLIKLNQLSKGGSPRAYARGMILSMTESTDDIRAGMKLVQRVFHRHALPVIPLFETSSALRSSHQIVREILRDPAFQKATRIYWNNYVEIMVGYSDSAKEAGVLPSRRAIAQTVGRLDAVFKAGRDPVPIYFHGSGGSIDRGGGSIEQQTAWWPLRSLEQFKATLQGEMVERVFSSPEIFVRQIEKIVEQRTKRRTEGKKPVSKIAPKEEAALHDFTERVSEAYRRQVSSPEFLELVSLATPYSYLDALRIGSRPTRRTGTLALKKLRAIPWILCWTQTRVLFPTWWGIGEAWRTSNAAEKAALKRAFQVDPLFNSYIQALGFTLAKVELGIFTLYLERSGLPPQRVHEAAESFGRECADALNFFEFITGQKQLLAFRPWLGTSIHLRAPMIHPLNLIQLIALRRRDAELLRTTVTGIASGMMTTG